MASRKAINKPFRIRKDFEKLDEKVVTTLNTLSRFFNSYPNIDQEVFFSAPHKIYPDQSYLDLNYFTTRKAISAYTLYIKQLEFEDPDSLNSLKRLQQSLIFLIKYCSENGLLLEEYESFTKGKLPEYITHLKNHKITFYTLHALQITSPKVESQILDFIFKDFYITFQKTKNSFFHSKKMKSFSLLAKQKTSDILKTERQNNK